MNSKEQRKNIISNFYKIAEEGEECSVGGLEFLSKDIDATRTAINLINEKSKDISKKINELGTVSGYMVTLKPIRDKILNKNYVYSNEETEEEYLNYLNFFIAKPEQLKLKTPDYLNLKDVLEKTEAPYYKKNKIIVEILKVLLEGDYENLDNLIKYHDDEMIKKECWARTIDPVRGNKAREESEAEEEEEAEGVVTTEEERSLEEQVATSREESRRARAERERRVDEAIRQRQLDAQRRIEEEEEERRRLLEEFMESFEQETVDREMGFDPALEQEDLDLQKIINQMQQKTTDPQKLKKLKEFEDDAEEIEGRYNAPQPRYYGGSTPQPSGFFASAIRRKMRLLKK
jgi:hypothetical protein